MGRTAQVHEIEGAPANAPKSGQRVIKDPTFVSEAKRKEYGVKPEEAVYWARDAEYWSQFEMTDRQDELMASPEEGGVGARVVYRNGEFDKVRIGGTSGDLILMAYPMEIKDAITAETDSASHEYQSGMKQTEEGYKSTEEIFDRDGLQERMEAEHEFHKRTGLVGGNSPTANMSYMEAAAHVKRLGIDVEAKQERLRMGGQHTSVDQKEFAQLVTGQRKLHGMGDSGFGRNPNSAVAQAARRSAAAGGK